MAKHTPLFIEHEKALAKIVDFAGWDMPLHYGSQLEEHHQVRHDAGMFDVSHMAVIDIQGKEAEVFLRCLLANDVAKLKASGYAQYTCMLNENGGVIDDLIVYWVATDSYRVIANAGTREKDLAWLQQQAKSFAVVITPRNDLAIIAVQGPNACVKAATVFDSTLQDTALQLKPFTCLSYKNWLIARTGYTGEDGFEITLPVTEVIDVWQKFVAAGIKPCGLGARDTLRLEAGLNLYGSDMDENVTPLESNLAWTIVFSEGRNFIGRAALLQQKEQGLKRQLAGLILTEKGGLLRNQQKVLLADGGEGAITSGGFAPTLGISIALARIPLTTADSCHVQIRDKLLPARIIKPPFVRHGKKMFD